MLSNVFLQLVVLCSVPTCLCSPLFLPTCQCCPMQFANLLSYVVCQLVYVVQCCLPTGLFCLMQFANWSILSNAVCQLVYSVQCSLPIGLFCPMQFANSSMLSNVFANWSMLSNAVCQLDHHTTLSGAAWLAPGWDRGHGVKRTASVFCQAWARMRTHAAKCTVKLRGVWHQKINHHLLYRRAEL